MNQALGRPIRSEPALSLSQAVEVARRSRERGSESLSDTDLEALLHYSAAGALSEECTDNRIADALAAVDTAVRRRVGIWRAATWLPGDLYGKIKCARARAEDALMPPRALAGRQCSKSNEDAACLALTELLSKLRTQHPTEVRLTADFYKLLESVDDAGCLRFTPTEQQLTAATLLLRGFIVEMDAGEGKTLASAMAAAVFAASGRSVHILTANDYLANRDCDALAPVLESLGLTVGLVTDGMDRQDRKFQYAAQIVFTTAREVGFDYLRDSVAESCDRRVNPTFDVAIVDEADHLLIDQARTPLIISGDRIPEPVLGPDLEALAIELIEKQSVSIDALYQNLALEAKALSQNLAKILLAGGLTPRLESELDRQGISTRQVFSDLWRLNDEDEGSPLERDLLFAIDPDRSTLRLTEQGWEEVYGRVDGPVSAFGTIQALRARVLHDAGTDYVLDQGDITLVDRLDGRPMFSHRYMHGLHEALESKEGLDRHNRADAKARTSIRALMSNYKTVAGLTGTAMEAADTFAREYGIQTVRVPAETESRRTDMGAEIFFDRDEHIERVVEEVAHWHSLGRPVLVTTGSVRESATFSAALVERSIPHGLLNAENAESESEIVARGGELEAVTISTGMAGRGTDFVVDHEVDSMVIKRTVTLARRMLERGRSATFVCPSHEESEALLHAFNEVEGIEAQVRNSTSMNEVVVSPLRSGPTTEQLLSFGLGLVVIITSLPSSARVERQTRGRTGRQGAFGASKVAVYINDPALAFSRRQGDIAKLSRTARGTVVGPEVGQILRQIQADAETQSEAVTRALSQYEALVESESRAHYATRVEMMSSHQLPSLPTRMISDWVMRRTADLDDQRTDYETRFAIVSDGLWHQYGIDIGTSAHLAPTEVRQDLELKVRRRLSLHRDRLGAKRYVLAVADCRLRAADDLWPARLGEMQEMALTLALGATSRHAAVTELAEQLSSTRADFWAGVDDRALRTMLDGSHIADRDRMDDNHIEQLPDELEALLR